MVAIIFHGVLNIYQAPFWVHLVQYYLLALCPFFYPDD